MNNEQNIEQAALAILRSTGISILDAAMLAKTALEAGGARHRQNGNLSAYGEVRASETTALRALKRESAHTEKLFPEGMLLPICRKACFSKVNTVCNIGMKHLFNTLMPMRCRSHATKQTATNEENTCYAAGGENKLRFSGRWRCHPFANFRRKEVIPQFIFRIRRKMRLQVIFFILNPGMVSTVIPDNVERVKPRGQCCHFQLPFLGNGAPDTFIRIIIEIGNKPHFGQGYRHPERRIIVTVPILTIKMIKEFNSSHDNAALTVPLYSYAIPFLQIIPPMWEVRCRSIGKRALSLCMRIGKATTKSNLYTLNGIQNKQTQISVKTVQKPDPGQSGSGHKRRKDISGSIALTERMPISTQAVITNVLQPLYQLSIICNETSGYQEVRLLFIRKMRLEILHK